MNPGDKVISDLDGKTYTVVKFGSRNEIEPLRGVTLLGNAVIVEDTDGKKQLLYEWECEKIK